MKKTIENTAGTASASAQLPRKMSAIGSRIAKAARAGPAGAGSGSDDPVSRASGLRVIVSTWHRPVSSVGQRAMNLPGRNVPPVRALFRPPAGKYPSQNRPARCAGGNPNDKTPENGASEIGVVLGCGQHGGRMGRNVPCTIESPASRGMPTRIGGRPLRRRGGDDGHQQHQAHFEEHRHAHDDAETEQSPGQPPAAILHQNAAQRSCSAGAGQQASQDRAQAEHDGDVPHEVADAGGERNGHLGSGIPDATPSPSAPTRAQARVQPDPRDQHQQRQHGSGHARQQIPAGRVCGGEGTGGLFHIRLAKRVLPRVLANTLCALRSSATIFTIAVLAAGQA